VHLNPMIIRGIYINI